MTGKLTAKQAELVDFLERHGPARHPGGSCLLGSDGFKLPIQKQYAWKCAYANVVRFVTVLSPRHRIPMTCFDAIPKGDDENP